MTGYFKLQRRFFTHEMWMEPREFSRAEAFLDLLQLAAYAHTKKIIKGNLVKLAPGQLCGSQRYLADRWGWSTKKVRHYIALLESDGIIEPQKNHEGTIITLCNYEKYNNCDDSEEPQKTHGGTAEEPQRNRIKEGEEGKENTPFAARQAGSGKDGGSENHQDQPEWLPKGWRSWSEKRKSQTRVGFNTEKMISIGRALGRKETTLWTIAETEALLRIKPSEEEIEMIVAFYLTTDIPEESDWRRRNLVTLLNNWNGELDKARIWQSESKSR